jgi:hypothetical protein
MNTNVRVPEEEMSERLKLSPKQIRIALLELRGTKLVKRYYFVNVDLCLRIDQL